MQRHAYLIMLHRLTPVCQTLLRMVDDPRNDIYIHIDARSDDFSQELQECVRLSGLYFVDRVKVYWGHISLANAEYQLFEAAYKHGGYSWYHLLSGSDLPIKSQDYIHDFFEKSGDRLFLNYKASIDPKDKERLLSVNLFPRHMKKGGIGYMLSAIPRNAFRVLQGLLGYPFFHHPGWIPVKGSNWVSAGPRFVALLLEHKSFVLEALRFSNCPDEAYKQMIALHEGLLDKVHGKGLEQNMRLINTESMSTTGHPVDYTIDDLPLILASDRIFCRKISDPRLASLLMNLLSKSISPHARQLSDNDT